MGKSISRLMAAMVLVLLSACGTTGLVGNQETLGYIMVSKGKASGAASLLGVGADYCKVTQSNLQGVSFTGSIVYGEESCRVEVTASDK